MADTVDSGFLPGYTDGGDGMADDASLKPGGPFCRTGPRPGPPEGLDPDRQDQDYQDQDDDIPCPFIPVDIMRPEPEDGETVAKKPVDGGL